MIKLRDSISIQSTDSEVFSWLESLPNEYVSWHPDHVTCRVLKGSMIQPGSEIECQERLHGKMHTLRFLTTRVEQDRRIEFKILALGRGAFEVVPTSEQVEFIAELNLGFDAPVVGYLADLVLRALFSRRLEAMRQHMREEGLNLMRIIESGWVSAIVS